MVTGNVMDGLRPAPALLQCRTSPIQRGFNHLKWHPRTHLSRYSWSFRLTARRNWGAGSYPSFSSPLSIWIQTASVFSAFHLGLGYFSHSESTRPRTEVSRLIMSIDSRLAHAALLGVKIGRHVKSMIEDGFAYLQAPRTDARRPQGPRCIPAALDVFQIPMSCRLPDSTHVVGIRSVHHIDGIGTQKLTTARIRIPREHVEARSAATLYHHGKRALYPTQPSRYVLQGSQFRRGEPPPHSQGGLFSFGHFGGRRRRYRFLWDTAKRIKIEPEIPSELSPRVQRDQVKSRVLLDDSDKLGEGGESLVCQCGRRVNSPEDRPGYAPRQQVKGGPKEQ